MYNEPPKIFPFTEFSINWIKGHLDHEATQNPRHDNEFDLDGHRINVMGYRIDHLDNVVDVFHDNILFKKEILSVQFRQVSEIPKIFTNGKLRPPQNCEIEKELKIKHELAMERGKRQLLDGMNGSDMEYSSGSNMFGKRPNKMGQKAGGSLARLQNGSGQYVADVPMSAEQRTMLRSPLDYADDA